MGMSCGPSEDSLELDSVILNRADLGQLCFNDRQVPHTGILHRAARRCRC